MIQQEARANVMQHSSKMVLTSLIHYFETPRQEASRLKSHHRRDLSSVATQLREVAPDGEIYVNHYGRHTLAQNNKMRRLI
jgi:hypothetical protein